MIYKGTLLMKRIKLTIGMFALVVGAVGAFAFSPAKAETTGKSGDTLRHWFDSNTGLYLGQRLDSQQDAICGPIKQVDCADGYLSITGDEGSEEPVGTAFTIQKANN